MGSRARDSTPSVIRSALWYGSCAAGSVPVVRSDADPLVATVARVGLFRMNVATVGTVCAQSALGASAAVTKPAVLGRSAVPRAWPPRK